MIKYLELEHGCSCSVEDNGNIYSKYNRLLNHYIDKVGYHSVLLRGNDGKQRRFLVHRLVAMAFINKNITRKDHVHHIDENKENNHLSNLHIIESPEHHKLHQQKYSFTKVCKVCGKEFTPHPTKRKRAVVCSEECKARIDLLTTEKQKKKYKQINKDTHELIKVWDCGSDIERELGFALSNICKCCNGTIKSAYGYIWEKV